MASNSIKKYIAKLKANENWAGDNASSEKSKSTNSDWRSEYIARIKSGAAAKTYDDEQKSKALLRNNPGYVYSKVYGDGTKGKAAASKIETGKGNGYISVWDGDAVKRNNPGYAYLQQAGGGEKLTKGSDAISAGDIEWYKKILRGIDVGLTDFSKSLVSTADVVTSLGDEDGGPLQELWYMFGGDRIAEAAGDNALGIKGLNFKDNPIKAFNKLGEKEIEYRQKRDAAYADNPLYKYSAATSEAAAMMASTLMGGGLATAVDTAALANAARIGQAASKLSQTGAIAQNAIKQFATRPDAQVIFGSSFGSSYDEAKQDGADDLQALVYAALNGAGNAVTELGGVSELGGLQKLPEWVKKAVNKGDKSLLLNYAKSIGEEASEEIIQGILGRGLKSIYSDVPLYDANDENSIINPKAAIEEATGAAVVSTLLGLPTTGINAAYRAKQRGETGRRLYGNSQRELVDEGLESERGTKSYELARKYDEKLNNGKQLSGNELYRLAQANEKAQVNEGTAVQSALETQLNEESPALPYAALNREQQLSELRNYVAQRSEMSAPVNTNVSNNEAVSKSINNVAAKIDATPEFVSRVYNLNPVASPKAFEMAFDAVYQMGQQGANKESLTKVPVLNRAQAEIAYNMGASTTQAAVDNAAVQGDNVSTQVNNQVSNAVNNTIQEVNNNGVRLHNVEERINGQNTEGQIHGVETGTGENVAGGSQKEQGGAGAAQIKAGEKVSYKGKQQKGVYYAAEDTEDMKKGRKLAESYGYNVTYFVGGNIRYAGGEFRGVVDTAKKTVMVRADHPDYTSEQIMRHEMGHAAFENGDLSIDEAREMLLDEFTADEINELIEIYNSEYGGILSPDEAFEEICCDALGRMNIFEGTDLNSKSYGKAQDTVRKYAAERTGSNGRAPPKKGGVKYSREPVSDSAYMKAVERGDTESAQRMVDEAAKKAGYTVKMYHGSKRGGGFTVFRDWSYFTKSKKYAQRYTESGNDKSLYSAYVKIENAFDTRKAADRYLFDEIRQEYGMGEIQDTGLPDWTDGYDIADYIDENGLNYDAIILDEGGDLVDGKPISRGLSYVIRNSNNIKSAEPITYDNNGNVIPLSERFKDNNPDIRYSREPERLNELRRQNERKLAQATAEDAANENERGLIRDYQKQYSKVEGIREKLSAAQQTLTEAEDSGADYDTTTKAKNRFTVLSNQYAREHRKLESYAKMKALQNVLTRVDERLGNDLPEGMGAASANFTGEETVGERWVTEAQGKGDSALHPISKEQEANLAEQQQRAPQEIPKEDLNGKLTSKHVSTIANSGMTPAEFSDALREDAALGKFSHIAYSDEEALKKAERAISEDGWDQALANYKAEINSGRVSKDNTVMGIALYNNAVNSGDYATAMDIASLMVKNSTNTAQSLQAMRILNKLSPECRLYLAAKSIENIEEDLNKRYKDNKADIHVDKILYDEYAKALRQGDEDGIKTAWANIEQSVAQQINATWYEKLNNFRYLAMLGNPRTHIRNIVGNAFFAPVREVKNIIAYGIENMADAKIDGGIERSKAILNPNKAADKALVDYGKTDYEAVQDIILSGGKFIDSYQGIDKSRTIYKNKILEAARKGNSYALDAEDAWFCKPAYSYALARWYKANGISAEQLVSGTVPEATIIKAQTIAIKEAQKATYRDTNKFSAWVSKLGKVDNKVASLLIEGILPFKKTPANILMRGLEYSPAGLIKSLAVGTKKVKAYMEGDVENGISPAQFIDDISAGLTGTALAGLGVLLASWGVLSGGDDDDEKQNYFDELSGSQSYALNIGGLSITLDWLAPESMPLFVGVEMYNSITGKKESSSVVGGIWSSLLSISTPVLELSMLQSFSDLISNIGYVKNAEGMYKILSKTTADYISQYFPTLFGQAERSFEEAQRETTYIDRNSAVGSELQYMWGKIANKIPFYDFSQIPYIDAWGRTEETGNLFERMLNNFVNPAYVKKERPTEIDGELERLYDLGETGVYPTRPKTNVQIKGEYLTADEYVAYSTRKGQLSLDLATQFINSAEYGRASDAEKAYLIKKAYEYANDIAKYEVNNDVGFGAKWEAEAYKSSNPGKVVLDHWTEYYDKNYSDKEN